MDETHNSVDEADDFPAKEGEVPANLPDGEVHPDPLPVGFTSPSASAALPVTTERRAHENIFWIERNRIEPNPYQPRREFDREALMSLADSLRTHGMLQPILVSRVEVETPRGMEVRYQLIAGERRWRAAELAGMVQVPVIIKKEPDSRMKLELALIENVQREDLNPIERARAFRQLMDEFKLVQREVAERIGKSREMVANALRLLSLPVDMQDAVTRGDITEGHARAILMAGDEVEKRRQLFSEILSEKLTVRQAEDAARRIAGREVTPRKRASMFSDPETRSWQNRLQEMFGTKVQVQKVGDKGKIVIEFYSDEELRAIIEKVLQDRHPERPDPVI
ncbi:MAG: ParB/RepB/Spo0J family partition protein [Candidatus Sungbacteria bacterium]|nr:ParB/RepB/Spo0J family partition protein [Candidatus Sungbacteria bacterium]